MLRGTSVETRLLRNITMATSSKRHSTSVLAKQVDHQQQGEKPESRQQLPENKLAGAFFHHGILPEKIWVGLGEVLHQLIDGVVSVLQVEGYAPLQGAVEPQGNQGIGLCRRVV